LGSARSAKRSKAASPWRLARHARRRLDGRWTYTPAADFNDTDALRYRLTEGGLVSNEATLTLLIAAVTMRPYLADRAVTLAEDSPTVIDPFATANDVDGDPLTTYDHRRSAARTLSGDATASSPMHRR
jgi:hypothetical protein